VVYQTCQQKTFEETRDNKLKIDGGAMFHQIMWLIVRLLVAVGLR
jgi:hypothetical protein